MAGWQSNRGLRVVSRAEAPDARSDRKPEWLDTLLVFALIFFVTLIPHLPLLSLPYFWDEAGYYIPAARDLLLTGAVIPHSTVTNAHPPLVMAWLALWWKLAGFAPVITRLAMLVVAAAALAGVFRLAARIASREVAIAATILTALFPPFFAQSTLAHPDMAAAAMTIWALVFFIERRRWACAVFFSLAVLAKETAIVAPLALFGSLEFVALRKRRRDKRALIAPGFLLVPLVPLAAWFLWHWARTGYVFGNPEFFRYNVAATFSIPRVLLALLQRAWQLTGYLNMYLLTFAAAAALLYPTRPTEADGRVVRMPPREQDGAEITVAAQWTLLVVMTAYVAMLSIVGGALLARYLLPVFPLWIVLCVATVRRRVRMWRTVTGVAAAAFAIALLAPQPYRISPEDTLAYRDFVELHQSAARELQSVRPAAAVLTAWPATDELQRPFLGYVAAPISAIAIEDFSQSQIAAAAQRNDWQMALLFSTKYEPRGGSLLDSISWWQRTHQRWFGYHEDLLPEAAAQVLHARVVWSRSQGQEWIAILQRE